MDTAIRLIAASVMLLCASIQAHTPHECPPNIPGTPALSGHMDQQEIINGTVSFAEAFAHGEHLFTAVFNECDGQGRPALTGCAMERVPDQPVFSRVSGNDSSSCADCHNEPRIGGSGGFVANVFVMAECEDPVIFSISPGRSAERNTPGMFGAGPLEMLAREMSADLQAQAAADLADGWHELTTKGVTFEVLIEAGEVTDSIGVDPDLIIKPFRASGRGIGIRDFTNGAFNHHHGLQSTDFVEITPSLDPPDPDMDGVEDELSDGDILAITLFQAALGTPVRVAPTTQQERIDLSTGERFFASIGCVSCHVPTLPLDSAIYTDIRANADFDMTTTGKPPRLEPDGEGGALVRAYTDLKIHNLCDAETDPDPIRYFCNEEVEEFRRDQLNEVGELRPGPEFFITRRLWTAGSSAPYGHRGDLPSLHQAIMHHGGDARAERDAYANLPVAVQSAIITFLKSLQAPPDGVLLVP